MQAVTRKELAEVIGEKTLHIVSKAKLSQSIASYLAVEHRHIDLASLTRDIMQYRLEHGVIEAVVVAAYELSPLVLKDVEMLLKDHFPHARKVIVDQRLDEDLVGGIRIELPREVLDLSVKSKLNRFKRLVAQEGAL